MKRLTILGKSSFALGVIIDILSLSDHSWESISIVSNIPDKENKSLNYPFKISGIEVEEYHYTDWTPDPSEQYIIGSIGRSRDKIFSFFNKHFNISIGQYINLTHPSSVVAKNAELGNGIHISPLTVVAPFSKLGDFVVLNRGVNVGHHVSLGNFVGINPGVTISGLCTIGHQSTIGAGATLLDNVSVGKNSVIGAGSVVTKDIPDNVIAYGVPAKVIREKS